VAELYALMSYNEKKGRPFISPWLQLTRTMPLNWHDVVLVTYACTWKEMWHNQRPFKGARFIWSVIHSVVAMHAW
jgi:hypothetical protein